MVVFMSSPEKAREVANRTLPLRLQKFIKLATEIHNGRYDYSLCTIDNYINHKSKLPIICTLHGIFHQTGNQHTSNKSGCPICDMEMKKAGTRLKHTLTTEKFITNSKQVFGDQYDYSESVCIGSASPVTIRCKEHGEFTVKRAEKHYGAIQGCPTCSKYCSVAESLIQKALNSISVPYKREYKFKDCVSPYTNRQLRFDFYLPSQSIIIEFHGDQHFTPNKMMHPGDMFQRFQHHDAIKKQYVLDNGLTYICFVTKDVKHLESLVVKLLS